MNDLSTAGKRIEFISEPASVNMADDWFEIATADHFWIRRRFEVARKMLRSCNLTGSRVAEVGCGHGLVQRQFEERFGVAVATFHDHVLPEYSFESEFKTHRRTAALGPHLMRRAWIVREFHLIKRGINHVLLIDDWAGGVF